MACVERDQRELAYRIYVTDALRSISENTAKFGGGGYLRARFADILHPKPEDTRTHDDVVSHIREKLRKLGEVE